MRRPGLFRAVSLAATPANPKTHRLVALCSLTAVAATALATSGVAGAAAPAPGGPVFKPHQLPTTLHTDAFPKSGLVTVMLQLAADPAATVYANAVDAGKSTATADAASKAQTQKVKALAAQVTSHLNDPATKARALFSTHAAYAGVAVTTDASHIAALSHLPGVAAVHAMPVKRIDNAVSVPLISAPQAWQFAGKTGKGVRVGIIDTGIDYTHADFGGAGTTTSYLAAKATDAGPWKPTAKVVGGYDFAGDDYNADPFAAPPDQPFQPVPHPDPNPLDCDGHGTHVAGTAAGFGENANGSTYKGAYNTSTPFASMKIGPGVAPQASLYALKIFGCSGSTNLVSLALDWAVDPNSDGNISDHLDVVNMSLGSDYGSAEDPDSVAADNATQAGMIVVAAAGNAGDLYDVGGSPGNAKRVIDVAASDDSTDWFDGLKVDAPASVAGLKPVEYSLSFDFAGKPDITGKLHKLTDPANPDGCSPYSPADAAAVKGKIAWVEWTDNDVLRACGSATRADNAAAAGAIGIVAHDDEDRFSAGLTGNALIPMVLMTKTAGDALAAAGIDNVTATFSGKLKLVTHNTNPAFNNQMINFSSRGETLADEGKPDVAAPGNTILSAGFGTGNGGQSDSGTSMATPHVAGLAALVVQAHPTWRPERIKADIINTATQDVFTGPGQTGNVEAPERVGAGRVVANAAVTQRTIAYNSTDHGSVGVSFGEVDVAPTVHLHKRVRIDNQSPVAVEYHVSYDAATTTPGVQVTVSTKDIVVPAYAYGYFFVYLDANAAQMRHVPDPTIDTTADLGGGLVVPRQFQDESSGRVVLTPVNKTAGSQLRVPVYSAPRPVSAMTQSKTVQLQNAGKGVATGTLTLKGSGVDAGNGAGRELSLASVYELQGTSPQLPDCTDTLVNGCIPFPDERAADLKSVGVSSDGNAAYFAVNTYGEWHTPASYVEYDVLIDRDGDNVPDLALFNTRLDGTDVFVSELVDLVTGSVDDIELLNVADGSFDTNAYNSDTMVLPVSLAALGVAPPNSRLRYIVQSQTIYGTTDTMTHWMSFDPFKPGVQVTQQGVNDVLYPDVAGQVLDVTADTAALAADHTSQLLVVHDFNAPGQRAQTVSLNITNAKASAPTP